MACVTMPPDIQGCLNIPLIRGDDKTISLNFTDGSGDPIDLSPYVILMQIRTSPQGALIEAKAPGSGIEVSGNQLNIVFDNDDPVYACNYMSLSYDIAFTLADVTQHWIKGQLLITKSETVTWK